jgi:LysR family glycine cleavage system transcriptional activator
MTPYFPSLNALRAFEAAARCGSFVAASAELGVSAAAVSQQVKQLEVHMAHRLFLRQGNRILLTDAGREIYPNLEIAFRQIVAVAQLGRTPPSRNRLVISVLPWMAPWLASALQGYDDPVEICAEADPVALTRGACDLRLTYGGALYPDHKVVSLFTDQMVAVRAPGLPPPLTLGAARLIHVQWGASYGSIPGWGAWYASQNLPSTNPGAGFAVNDPAMAVALAAQGRGVALLPRLVLPLTPFLHADNTGMALSWPYVLICLNARARNRPLAGLIGHLTNAAVTTRVAVG